MLHIVKHYQSLPEAMDYSAEGDIILLVEDAVYAALTGHRANGYLNQKPLSVYFLEADIKARGLVIESQYTIVDYSGFVELTEQNASSITWE